MNKILIALVLAVVMSGNAYSDEKFPDKTWIYHVVSDPINGQIESVAYQDTSKKQVILIRKNNIVVTNGDSYICRCVNCPLVSSNHIYGIIKIDGNMPFGLDLYPFGGTNLSLLSGYIKKYENLNIRYNRDAIKDISDGLPLGGRKLNLKKFVNKLKNSSNLFIRTIDGCDNQIDINVNLNGISEVIDKLFPYLDDDLKN